jgi:hypothetical protein
LGLPIGAVGGGLGVDGSVTDSANPSRLVATRLDGYGGIDGVVNSMGPVPKGELLKVEDDT